MQLIVLLDFVYFVNEWLLERDHCQVALIGLTGALLVGTFVGAGFLYKVSTWPQVTVSLKLYNCIW